MKKMLILKLLTSRLQVRNQVQHKKRGQFIQNYHFQKM